MLKVPPTTLRLQDKIFWRPGRYGTAAFIDYIWNLRYHVHGNRPSIDGDLVVEGQTLVELAVYLGMQEIECHDNGSSDSLAA